MVAEVARPCRNAEKRLRACVELHRRRESAAQRILLPRIGDEAQPLRIVERHGDPRADAVIRTSLADVLPDLLKALLAQLGVAVISAAARHHQHVVPAQLPGLNVRRIEKVARHFRRGPQQLRQMNHAAALAADVEVERHLDFGRASVRSGCRRCNKRQHHRANGNQEAEKPCAAVVRAEPPTSVLHIHFLWRLLYHKQEGSGLPSSEKQF